MTKRHKTATKRFKTATKNNEKEWIQSAEFIHVSLLGEVWKSYLNTGEMKVHDTGHVETHTQHQQQQHQHPPERQRQRKEKGFPSFH